MSSSFFSSFFFQKSFIAGFSIKVLPTDVSSVVGAPWRCGVLTTQGEIAGIGLGRLLGGEHGSPLQSGVEAPRLLKRSFTRTDCCCCLRHGRRATYTSTKHNGLEAQSPRLMFEARVPVYSCHPVLDEPRTRHLCQTQVPETS